MTLSTIIIIVYYVFKWRIEAYFVDKILNKYSINNNIISY